jgi:hypothetical protein
MGAPIHSKHVECGTGIKETLIHMMRTTRSQEMLGHTWNPGRTVRTIVVAATGNHDEGEHSQQEEPRDKNPVWLNGSHSTVEREFLVV